MFDTCIGHEISVSDACFGHEISVCDACLSHMISSIHDVMALQLCMPESWLITLTNLVSERKEIAACHHRGSVSCLFAQNLLDRFEYSLNPSVCRRDRGRTCAFYAFY